MKGDLKPQDILTLMQDTFRFVAEYEGEVPGAAPQDCGNYLLHDLPMAKWESAKYLHEVLEQMKEENMKYPEKKKNKGLGIKDKGLGIRDYWGRIDFNIGITPSLILILYYYTISIPCSLQSCNPKSFSLNFCILPLPVMGNSLMKKIYLGIL